MNKEYYYNVYLKSDEWKILRNQVLEKYNYKCTLCGSDKDLNIHHLRYSDVDYELGGEDEIRNLILLCNKCHFNFHNIKQKEYVLKQNLKNDYIKAFTEDPYFISKVIELLKKYNELEAVCMYEAIGKNKTKYLNTLQAYFHENHLKDTEEILKKSVLNIKSNNKTPMQLLSELRK